VHIELQQTPSTQAPGTVQLDAVAALHGCPFGIGTHDPFEQTSLMQSLGTLQCLPTAHGPHGPPPPQSMSVSFPLCMPSLQSGGTHMPLALQTAPPLSLHAVPLGDRFVTHALPEHVTVAHFVFEAVQSLFTMHAVQVPLPSQTLPPFSLHGAPAEAIIVPHSLAVQVLTMHAVG
jgi:hypothetical protein